MMSRRPRLGTQLDRESAAKIKGMLVRGDDIDDISVWFGVNAHVVSAVQSGAVHPYLDPAPPWALPPRGPYMNVDSAYGALKEVRRAEEVLEELSARVRWGFDCER